MPTAADSRRVDFVERIFNDFVEAGYNYIVSVVRVIKAPARGAIRLAVRRQSTNLLQLAPQTILFITLFVLLLDNDDNFTEAIRSFKPIIMRQAVPTAIFLTAAKAMGITVGIDLLARAIAYLRFRRAARLRRRAFVVISYTYAAAFVYLGLSAIVLGFIDNRVSDNVSDVLGVLIWAVMLPFVVLIARILQPGSRLQRTIAYVAATVAIASSVAVAFFVLMYLGDWLKPSHEPVKFSYFQCSTNRGMAPTATVGIDNTDDDEPVVIGQKSLMFGVSSGPHTYGRVRAVVVDSSFGRTLPVYIIPGHTTAWLRFEGEQPVDWPADVDVKCSLYRNRAIRRFYVSQ